MKIFKFVFIISFILNSVVFAKINTEEKLIEKCQMTYLDLPQLMPMNRGDCNLYENFFVPLLEEKEIKTVVEVGAYLGNWTLFMADMLPEGGKVYAVDRFKILLDRRSNPLTKKLYSQFLSNVIHMELEDRVVPIKMKKTKAVKLFKKLKIKADLIYINSPRDHQSIYKDLKGWFPILEKDGLLCGNGWKFRKVRSVVQAFAKKHNFITISEEDFWRCEPWQAPVQEAIEEVEVAPAKDVL